MSTHDKRSPSQLKRYYMCPGSYQLQINYEKATGKEVKRKTSDAALRGIALHSCIEQIVSNSKEYRPCDIITVGDKGYYQIQESDIPELEFVVNEVRSELSILEDGDDVFWEQQVDLSKYNIESKEDGNRVDMLISKKNGAITIIDFKFGSGYVDEPQFNLQLGAYAVGTIDTFGESSSVTAIILQPKAFNEKYTRREHTYIEHELSDIRSKIVSIINSTENQDAKLSRGDHCVFCPMKQMCPLHRDSFLNIPTHMNPEEFFQSIDSIQRQSFYENLLSAKAWIETAVCSCEELILGGLEVHGYDIGEGRKARKWSADQTELMETYPELTEQKLMSPSSAEKKFGKKRFREVYEPHVVTEPGNPKVVKSRKS